jgi:hypothetical protein
MPYELSSRSLVADERVVRKLADNLVKRLKDKIASERYVVLAKGKLVEGEEKHFVTLEVPQFLEFLSKEISDQALAKLGIKSRQVEDYAWWGERKRETVKKGEKDEFDELFEPSSEELDAFEESLESPILTVYEEDIRDFVEGIGETAAELDQGGMSDYEVYRDIVDLVRERVDRIEEDITRWGSRYINVIKGNSNTRQGICKIFDIIDFRQKLFKISEKRALELAGVTDEEFYEPISENYFDEEFFV